jgi:hypothetical protein
MNGVEKRSEGNEVNKEIKIVGDLRKIGDA